MMQYEKTDKAYQMKARRKGWTFALPPSTICISSLESSFTCYILALTLLTYLRVSLVIPLLGLRFPAAVHPEVLFGRFADGFFYGAAVFLRDPVEFVVAAFPFLGHDDSAHA